MKKIIFALLVVMFGTIFHVSAEEKTLTMGYKDKHKMPLIGGEGDDSGLYKELFEKAADKIGYRLKIARLSKRRVHFGLNNGSIDFYPGASFSLKRAEYMYYMPNGLQTKEVLISQRNKREINDMSEAKGRLLVELGSSKAEWDDKYPGLKIIEMGKLPIDIVFKAVKRNRGDYYIADIEVVDYYKKINRIKDYGDIGFKIHHNAVNNEFIPMYLGFSRKSNKFAERVNPAYDHSKETTIENFPSMVSKDCLAYKFYSALKEFKDEGETKTLYDKYFK